MATHYSRKYKEEEKNSSRKVGTLKMRRISSLYTYKKKPWAGKTWIVIPSTHWKDTVCLGSHGITSWGRRQTKHYHCPQVGRNYRFLSGPHLPARMLAAQFVVPLSPVGVELGGGGGGIQRCE